ncbi:MAG: peptidoglycan-binding protein [Candidatus Ventricola sp.]
MKRVLSLLLLLALCSSAAARAERILFEDENGKVILEDDGSVGFLPPDASAQPPLASAPDATPLPRATPTPAPDATPLSAPGRTLQYGDAGDHVLAAQQRLTALGYYHGQCSGKYLEGTQSAVRRFQGINALKQTGKLDSATWALLFSAAAAARDGSQPDATPSPVPPETPTPSPAPFSYTRKLQYGDSGALVERLQLRLAELGFYDAKASGGYYSVTQSAVRAFQAHNGLTADGVAGRQTQELLFSADALPAWAPARPAPTAKPAQYALVVDVTNQITRAYTYDETGAYTVLVREMICSTGTASNPTPLGTTLMPQKRARWGYFPTWDSHAQYLTRIDSANAFHSVLYTAADETTLSVKSFEALGTPASHGCVRLYVSDAKWIYDNCGEGTPITVMEGEYDPEYTMTLRRTLNRDTLRENPLPAPTPEPIYAPENWPTAYRTLSRGKQGEDVYMVQMRLRELGYYAGSVTGGYYGGTIEAVKAFQRDHGLTVDGAAGQQTQALLFSSAVDPTPEATPTPTPSPAPTGTPVPTAVPSPTPAPSPTPFAPLPGSVG